MKINNYKCDHCGYEQGQMSYGGKIFIPYPGGKDFCDDHCLIEYLLKKRGKERAATIDTLFQNNPLTE